MSRDVIDLTSPATSPAGTSCLGDLLQGKDSFSLAQLSIGERLGASRDGGEGYQVWLHMGRGSEIGIGRKQVDVASDAVPQPSCPALP